MLLSIHKLIHDLENIKISKTIRGMTQKNSKIQTNMVIEILNKHNFKQLPNIRKIPSQTGLYFVEQPNGTQKFPDFTLISKLDEKETKLDLELKVGSKKIMWNDGFPKREAVYLFSCTKYIDSKLYTGNIIEESDYQQYEDLCKLLKKINLEKKVKTHSNPFSIFRFYVRKATSQPFDIQLLNDTDNVVKLLSVLNQK